MEYEISWWQLYMTMIAVPLTSLTTFSPILTAPAVTSRDVWIAVIVSATAVTAVIWLVYALSERFEGLVVTEYVRVIFGPYIGFLINLALTLLFIYWIAISIKQFGFFFITAAYLRTPVTVFSLLLLALAVFAVAEGFEFIGRIAEIAGVLVIFGLVFYMVSTTPETEFTTVMPVLADGWAPVWEHALAGVGVFGDAIWTAMLGIPYVNRLKQARKSIWWAYGTTMTFYIAGVILIVGLFGPELTSILSLPALSAARLVSLGNIFERLEWLALVMWLGAMGVRVSVLLYGASLAVKTYARTKKFSGPALICGGAAFVWSLFIFQRMSNIFAFYEPENFLRVALPLQMAPIAFFIVAAIRGVRSPNLPDEEVGP